MPSPRQFDDRRCFLGESPRWDPRQERLVWIDILAGRILTRRLDGSEPSSLVPGGRVGGIVVRAEGRGYVIGRERSVLLLAPDATVERTLVERIPGDAPQLRTNEMALDPAGRIVFGTMAGNKAKGDSVLWRLEPSGDLTVLREGLTISNGMGWTADGTAMYHVDSPTHQVVRLPYGDDGCGTPEVVATIEEDAGVPDGLCVDADGGFWVAVNGGGQCRHFTADGTETDRVEVPAPSLASCVLVAGAGGSQLYMTTGASGMGEEDLLAEPGSGFVFVVDVAQAPADPPEYPG